MPRDETTEAELREVAELNDRHEGNISRISKETGFARSTVRRRLDKAKLAGLVDHTKERIFDSPDLPSEEMDTEALVDHITRRAETAQAAADSRDWVPIKIKIPGPVGIVWMGDPHIDDVPGCDWPTLRRHIETIQSNPAMIVACLGDVSNNWVGKLQHLWAATEVSDRQQWQLVEWLFDQLRGKLALLVKGNHDLWSGAGDPLNYIKAASTYSAEWAARVEFRFPKGEPFKVWAAHDMPGHSQYWPLHAQQKRAKFTGYVADLLISGHRHTWGWAKFEDDFSNRVYHVARAKGYKQLDDYAVRLGHGSQKYGHSIVSVYDPLAPPNSRVLLFDDVELASDWLDFRRAAYAEP